MEKKPKLLMLKGLPASGKTKHAKELVDKGWVRVNKDDLRAMMHNSKWSKVNEEAILMARDQLVLSNLFKKNNVVVDDTNFDEKHQARLQDLADQMGADFEVMFIDTPLEECIKRNEQRANKVPVSVIYGMHKKYIAPLRDKMVEQNDSLEECIIVDVDGTLAHISANNPRDIYDASRAMDDDLDDAVSNVVGMAYAHGYRVIVLTGRNAEHLDITKEWLEKNGVSYDEIYSRTELDVDERGQPLKDTEVKERLFRTHILPRFYTKYVIDDRPSVCRMWRSLGLKVFQVGDPHVEF